MSELGEVPPIGEHVDEAPIEHASEHASTIQTGETEAVPAATGNDERGAGVLQGGGAAWPAPLASDLPPDAARQPSHPASAVWPTIASWHSPLVSPDPPPGQPDAATGSSASRGHWLRVAVVAAVIGAIMGGATAWIARDGGSIAQITIRQGTTLPGPAILASGTPIPRLVDAVAPSVVSIAVVTGSSEDEGTGMIISSNGLVVTNNHVISAITSAGGGSITVTRTGTSTVLPATLLGTSATYDVALLQIQNVSGLPAITFGNSSKLVVGDSVVTIGNALGLAAGTPTVTSGIVSALGRTVSASNSLTGATETLYGMIQTDAAINPGNSGGPLIDSSGQVVGMNTAVAGATSDGSAAQNIGFAIPAARIEHMLASLLRMHLPTTAPHPKGGFLGVQIVPNTTALAKQYGLGVSTGAFVRSVIQGDPAQLAGILADDVIVSINGTSVLTEQAVSRVMATIKPGSTVRVIVERGRTKVGYYVTVVARPGA
jgi:putative serine protease PepD